MTPEGKVKKLVDSLLKNHLSYKHKPVMNGMGERALDYHVCHVGLYAGIETKDEGKNPTPQQTIIMRKVVAAGGSLFLIRGERCPDLIELHLWLKKPTVGFVSTAAAQWLKEKESELLHDRSGDSQHEE